ncbi:AMMECR1 family protein [Penicillium digitatum]|uniref:AMMECR1 family protein n=1 Tax=Penicillium digitatum TaxID=36651 RepID=A0A7T6XH47_PENDI|nr:AMMECR1 family protein [Penicillium digitatum]
MANTAQCYYCFESLLTSFEDREPPTLVAVEALWEQHEQTKKLSSLEEQIEDDADQQPFINEQDEDDESNQSSQLSSQPKKLQLRSIGRLQSQFSASSSAATSSSSASNTSSNSLQSSSTNITTPSAVSNTPQLRSPGQRYPLFVTWNTLSRSGHKSLRGCIGTFEGQELAAGLKSYALTSAFDDTRFEPIPKSLLPSLSCSLTLLGSFEPCTNPMDWSLGTHGLRISFIHRGRRYGATYLPDVAVEQGWTKEETVESLMRKAGWDGGGGTARRLLRGVADGNVGATKPWDQVSDFRTVRYQGLKASASYAEWQEWREWVLSLDDGEEILEGAA